MTGPDRPPKPDPVRERIVEAFTERARTLGPRSVVMAELARDLGISTRTLYKHFRSKDGLVAEVLERLMDDVVEGQRRRLERKVGVVDRIHETAQTWLETRIRFSATFWREVHQHYPDAMKRWKQRMALVWARARSEGVKEFRDDVPPMLSASILMNSIRHAADPDRCDRLGISRQQAVAWAVDLWARGAVKRSQIALVPAPAAADSED